MMFKILMILPIFIWPSGSFASEQKDHEVRTGQFKSAGIVFPIDNVTQYDNIIDMTITKNARGLRQASTAYEISVMHKVTTPEPETCPLVNSTAIDKQVKSYNPFTGRANLKITFISNEMAEISAKSDCLLIRDTETEPYSDY
ncbi:MAG: hypothetical protein AAF549_08525 [Pseudomonadota bacterium]